MAKKAALVADKAALSKQHALEREVLRLEHDVFVVDSENMRILQVEISHN